MRKLCSFIFLVCCTLALPQQKANFLDINYTMSRNDIFGIRFSTRLSEEERWNLNAFNGGAFWKLAKGSSSLVISYDSYRVNGYSPIGYRYGFIYSSSGPHSTLSLSLFQNDNFTNLKGFSGKIDLNIKF